MKDEFSDRHQAIKGRLAGHSVEFICQALGRSREWLHFWWRRYQALGVAGLYDLTRANCQLPGYTDPGMFTKVGHGSSAILIHP